MVLFVLLVCAVIDVARIDAKIAAQKDPQLIWELSHYVYSKPLYWCLIGISTIKIYSLVVLIVWLCNDNERTREFLPSAMAVNSFTSLGCFAFGSYAMTAGADLFFPRGMTDGGKWYNFKVTIAGLVPGLFYLYYWRIARKFRDMEAPKSTHSRCC